FSTPISPSTPTFPYPTLFRSPDRTPLLNFKEFENVIPVREGRTISSEVIGVSDGMPNQRYKLAQPSLLGNTLEVLVETVPPTLPDRKSTRLNSSHEWISYAVF